MLDTLLNAVKSATTSSEFRAQPQWRAGYGTGVVQAVITGTATVELQGSLDGSNWHTLASFSSNGMEAVTLPQYYRAVVTSYSSGDVTLIVQRPANYKLLQN